MHAPFLNERGTLRQRFSSRLCGLFGARASVATVAVFAALHGFAWSSGNPEAVLGRFWLSGDEVAGPELWRWLSHAFVHGNGWHLAINSLALWIVGSKVERISGPGGMLKVFFSGVLIGAAMQVLAAPPVQRGLPLVGASGGIFALLLWLTTVDPDLRVRPLGIRGKNLGRGIVAAESALLVASWWLPEPGLLAVAHGCHLGGALAGWVLGRRVFRRTPSLDDLKKERARRESADGPLK